MRSYRRRATAVLSGCTVLLSLVGAAPASAAPMICHVLPGPTPSAEVDSDGDGDPEVRVPSLTNVGLCVQADIVLDEQPGVRSEPCAEWGTCWRFYVDYRLAGYVQTGMQVCYTADGNENCTLMPTLRIPINHIDGGTMCIGVDLAGGRPCADGELVSFE